VRSAQNGLHARNDHQETVSARFLRRRSVRVPDRFETVGAQVRTGRRQPRRPHNQRAHQVRGGVPSRLQGPVQGQVGKLTLRGTEISSNLETLYF